MHSFSYYVVIDLFLIVAVIVCCWQCPLARTFDKVAFVCLMIVGGCAIGSFVVDCGGYYGSDLSALLSLAMLVMMAPFWTIITKEEDA